MRKADGLMAIEISVQDYTKIEILDPVEVSKPEESYRSMELKDVASAIGQRVCINAYIKMKLDSVVYNNSSYGSGSVTDLKYKLLLNVTKFNNDVNPDAGTKVQIKGTLRENEHKTVFLQVTSMDDIQSLNASVTEEELRRGYLPLPKFNTSDRPHDEFSHSSQKSSNSETQVPASSLSKANSSQEMQVTEEILLTGESQNKENSPGNNGSDPPAKRSLKVKEEFPLLPDPKKPKKP